VGFQQARYLHGCFFAVARGARNAGNLGYVEGHRYSHATQNLNALGDGVY